MSNGGKDHSEGFPLEIIPGHIVRLFVSRRTRTKVVLSKLKDSWTTKRLKDSLPDWKIGQGYGGYLLGCITHKECRRWSCVKEATRILSTPEIFCEKCKKYLDSDGLDLRFE